MPKKDSLTNHETKIIVCGDTHGTLDLDKVIHFFDEHIDQEKGTADFTKSDYLIICGDVGVCGFSASEQNTTREILRELPVTVLFIDGNHEHFGMLYDCPESEWNGGKVHVIEPDILHLMRGQVYDLGGTRIFTFGGAASTDRMYRTEGIDWFPEEIPTREEYDEGIDNLEKCGYRVDYIFSHTGPWEVVAEMGYDEWSLDEKTLRRYLQHIADTSDFKAWYFGHFHEDTDLEKFHCLMERVVMLEE